MTQIAANLRARRLLTIDAVEAGRNLIPWGEDLVSYYGPHLRCISKTGIE